MRPSASPRAVLAAALAPAVAIALGACAGRSTIRPEGAARSVVSVVARQTGFRPTDVACPSGVDAKVGGTFICHFTGPGGRRYNAFMRITKVAGERVIFYVRTRPAAH